MTRIGKDTAKDLPKILESFAAKLREYRRSRDVTQLEMTEELGVSISRYRYIENCSTNYLGEDFTFTLEFLWRFGKLTHRRPSEILREIEDEVGYTKSGTYQEINTKTSFISNEIDKLHPQERDEFLKLITHDADDSMMSPRFPWVVRFLIRFFRLSKEMRYITEQTLLENLIREKPSEKDRKEFESRVIALFQARMSLPKKR